MNRKQRRANKVKPFQSLGKNMVALPNTAVLNSDAQFEDQGYVKVRFPVNETSKQKGIGSERMWVKITEGDKIKVELRKHEQEIKLCLDDLQNLLKEDGNTKIEIKIRKTSKVYTFALKNLRKFNVGTFNHIKDKEYVEKIIF